MTVTVKSDSAGAKDKVHTVQTLTPWAAAQQDSVNLRPSGTIVFSLNRLNTNETDMSILPAAALWH